MEKPRRERSANFSPEEINTLVNIAFKYKDTIENKATNAIVWNRKDKAWKVITAEFNSEMLTNRTTKTLRNKYECLKVQLRKKALRNQYDMDRGNSSIPLECFEEKLYVMETTGLVDVVGEVSDFEFMMSEGNPNEVDYSNCKEQMVTQKKLLTKDFGKLFRNNKIKYGRCLSEKLSKLEDLRKELCALQIKLASKKVHIREQELMREKELFMYKKKLLHCSMRNEKLKDDARYVDHLSRISESTKKRRLRHMEALQMCLDDDFPSRSDQLSSNELFKVKTEVDDDTEEFSVKQENSELGIDYRYFERKARMEEAENARFLRRNIMEDEIMIKLEIDEDVDGDEKDDNFEFVDVLMHENRDRLEQMDPVPNLFVNKSDLERAIVDEMNMDSDNMVLNLKIEKE